MQGKTSLPNTDNLVQRWGLAAGASLATDPLLLAWGEGLILSTFGQDSLRKDQLLTACCSVSVLCRFTHL